jgi:chromosome segregation ATPase
MNISLKAYNTTVDGYRVQLDLFREYQQELLNSIRLLETDKQYYRKRVEDADIAYQILRQEKEDLERNLKTALARIDTQINTISRLNKKIKKV